ncbi:hypothetical protein [Mariprofundus erugo]|nr:hypothetical protein [Mariprofundus erugo]
MPAILQLEHSNRMSAARGWKVAKLMLQIPLAILMLLALFLVH